MVKRLRHRPLHGGNTGSIPVGVIIIFRLSKEMPVSYRQKIEKKKARENNGNITENWWRHES